MPTIAIESSSSQKHRSDVQSYSSAQQCAPPWMLKAIAVQLLHHRLRFLWSHLTTAAATAAMRLKSRTGKVASQYGKKSPATSACVDVFGLSGLPAEVAIILCESDILAIRTKTQRRTHRRSLPTTSRRQLVHWAIRTVAAMSPREHPSTQIELPPQGERGVASPPLGPPSAIDLRPLHGVHPQ